jgi:hypothetical protein
MKVVPGQFLVVLDRTPKMQVDAHCEALDTLPVFHKLIAALGGRIAWAAGASRAMNIACPKCGLTAITAIDAAPLKITAGVYPLRPEAVHCESCDYGARASQLVRAIIEPKAVGPFVRDNFPNLEPKLTLFTAAKHGSSTAVDTDADRACQRALPAEHDRTIEVCRIKTYDLARAVLCVQEKGDELPWKKVEVTPTGEIENPRWHGGVPTLQENVRARQRDLEQRSANLKQLNSDVEAYRLERAVELGL